MSVVRAMLARNSAPAKWWPLERGLEVSTAFSTTDDDETVTTPVVQVSQGFASTLRWFRERLLGLSVSAIDAVARRDFADTRFTCAKFEQPDQVLTSDDIGLYEKALWILRAEFGSNLIGGLVDAHFGAAALTSNLEGEVLQRQLKEWNRGYAVGLGLDIARPDNSIFATACHVWPSARNILRPDDLRDFAQVVTRIAAYRKTAVLTRTIDVECSPLSNFAAKIRGARHAWELDAGANHPTLCAGVGRTNASGIPIAIDPLGSVQLFDEAWRIARVWGADPTERTALAWAILLIRFDALNSAEVPGKPLTPILHWALLDTQGPDGYQRVLTEANPNPDPGTVPPADLIWAAARKYLSGWHSNYVAVTYDLRLQLPALGAEEQRQPPAIEQTRIGTVVVDNATLADRVVIYDHTQLPGLPEVLSLNDPVLVVSPTRIAVHSMAAEPDEAWWLPTGLNSRLLVRKTDADRWEAVQMPRGIY